MIKNFEIFEAKIKWYSKGGFGEEEDVKDNLSSSEKLKVGDRIKLYDVESWDPKQNKFSDYEGHDKEYRHEIIAIEKAEDAENLPYGKGLKNYGDEIVFRIKNKWPWWRFKR